MGKNLWLGRYELIKDKPQKFAESCVIETNFNKKLIKEAGKPDKVALWNFICNPRDLIMIIGWNNPPIIGYDNNDYMSFFQRLTQIMWKNFEPKFNEFLPIIPLFEAKQSGLYDSDCLREQFPGAFSGCAPGYPTGSFKKRQIGGWRWFSLILDEENWKGEWHEEFLTEKLVLKDKIKENKTPKYYKSFTYLKGKWVQNKNGKAVYKYPNGCNYIPRRYSVPVVVGIDKNNGPVQRYRNFINRILQKLKTQWTLNVWNILCFDYKPSELGEIIEIKPEINIDLGWIETYALGKKKWGDIGEGLHRHYNAIYNIRLGLPNEYKLTLQHFVNKMKNEVWDGTIEGIAKVLEDPYSKLVDIAAVKLKELIEEKLISNS
jgi:hypothetical protein